MIMFRRLLHRRRRLQHQYHHILPSSYYCAPRSLSCIAAYHEKNTISRKTTCLNRVFSTTKTRNVNNDSPSSAAAASSSSSSSSSSSQFVRELLFAGSVMALPLIQAKLMFKPMTHMHSIVNDIPHENSVAIVSQLSYISSAHLFVCIYTLPLIAYVAVNYISTRKITPRSSTTLTHARTYFWSYFGGFKRFNNVFGYMMLLFGVILFVFIMFTCINASPHAHEDSTVRKNTSLMNPFDCIHAGVLHCFAKPLIEEVIYRGFIFGRLITIWNPAFAYLTSTIAFCTIHDQFNLQTIYASLLCCLSYHVSGRLIVPIMLHMIWNIHMTALEFYNCPLYPQLLTQDDDIVLPFHTLSTKQQLIFRNIIINLEGYFGEEAMIRKSRMVYEVLQPSRWNENTHAIDLFKRLKNDDLSETISKKVLIDKLMEAEERARNSEVNRCVFAYNLIHTRLKEEGGNKKLTLDQINRIKNEYTKYRRQTIERGWIDIDEFNYTDFRIFLQRHPIIYLIY